MDEETIRKAAYRIWEAQGRPHGQDFDHWYRARTELDDQDSDGLAGSIASSVAPPMPVATQPEAPATPPTSKTRRKASKS